MEKNRFVLEFEKPIHLLEDRIKELQKLSDEHKLDVSGEIASIESKIAATRKEIYSNLTPWQRIQVARHPERPYAPDYIKSLFTDYQELHGDRNFGDDQALTGGTAFFEGKSVMILSQQKGRDTRENLKRNFGMPSPEGYRKALRLAKMAERFKLPLICFIDTPGAYPGLGSEERHVSEAIATNLMEFSGLSVPIISIVLGEGGSGGALGIGVANRILVMQYAYYSVISPEGCAAILWKDRAHAAKAAAALKISGDELVKHGIADALIPEPIGGAHYQPQESIANLGKALSDEMAKLRKLSAKQIMDQRYEKFRKIGVFEEDVAKSQASAEAV